MSAIWFHSENQEKLAQTTKTAFEVKNKGKCFTKIARYRDWTNAEFYHQKYNLQYKKEFMVPFKSMSELEFINSPVVAKVSGICEGKMDVKDAKEWIEMQSFSSEYATLFLEQAEKMDNLFSGCGRKKK